MRSSIHNLKLRILGILRVPNCSHRFRARTTCRGFTLIELMVTVGIFVFMTAIILSKYNSFYSGTIFKNLAYDIALTIRQAQTYGISVKVAESLSNKDFNKAYGVRFNLSANSKQFQLSAYDKSGNLYTQDSNSNLNLRTFNIKQGAKIQSICVVVSGNTCTDITNFSSPYRLDIIFQRPNPEALICTNSSCTNKSAKITLVASDGTTIYNVGINNVGQITVFP